MRRFYLDRPQPKGCVAQGVLFVDGTIALRWFGAHASTALYPSLATFKAIHVEAHEGTKIRWRDKCCFACGACVMTDEAWGCMQCGATWDPGNAADEIEPNGGRWVLALSISATPPPTEQAPGAGGEEQK